MVNHFSNFISAHLIYSMSVEETLSSKKYYEQQVASYVVKVNRHHTDNGLYADKMFLDTVEDANQDIKFHAVGAHHHNGISESHIKILTLGARTLLLRARRHWPE